jgi:hypothetical protein
MGKSRWLMDKDSKDRLVAVVGTSLSAIIYCAQLLHKLCQDSLESRISKCICGAAPSVCCYVNTYKYIFNVCYLSNVLHNHELVDMTRNVNATSWNPAKYSHSPFSFLTNSFYNFACCISGSKCYFYILIAACILLGTVAKL